MHHLHPHRDRSPDRDGVSRRRLLSVLLVAQLMVILDIPAVNIALPDLARDLRIGASEIGWTITSYSLLFGSLRLLGGRAADLLANRFSANPDARARLPLEQVRADTAARRAGASAG
jgi:MFS family permease